MRAHLHNLLLNLGGPVTTANYLLQGEFGYASEAMQRFIINSTVGLVGVFDVATDWGIPQRNRDFGETLGELGIPNGPYLVIPLEGSSALRDFAGSYVDGYFSPLRYVGEYNGRPYVGMFKNVLGSVDNRSANIQTYRDIERTSVDFYATMRSMYLQRRARLVQDKEVVTADLPDF
jgi:phospholipid-binding lipoprotein MlaA